MNARTWAALLAAFEQSGFQASAMDEDGKPTRLENGQGSSLAIMHAGEGRYFLSVGNEDHGEIANLSLNHCPVDAVAAFLTTLTITTK